MLPNELIVKIFKRLDLNELKNLRLTSMRFNQLMKSFKYRNRVQIFKSIYCV